MAVIYLFDAQKTLKRPVRDVVELIHHEGQHKATVLLRAGAEAAHGEFFGFACADGRFRLFEISSTEKNDEGGFAEWSGYDAALAELNGIVLEQLSLKDTTLQAAVADAVFKETPWKIGAIANGTAKINLRDAYFETAWGVLRNLGRAAKVRILPYYEYNDGKITARKVDFADKTPVYRGVTLSKKRGARNIHIIREGTPYGRVYPLGKVTGSGDPPEQLTIAEAVWSAAAGDPADKPSGQKWLALPGATSTAGYVYEDKRAEDAGELMRAAYEDLLKTQSPKATGTANIGELELAEGYTHRVVRMWDLVPVCTEDGELVEATVTNIDRYHVHRKLTKIAIGDEDDDENDLETLLANMSQTVAQTAVSAGGAGAGAQEAKRMVLEAEEKITLHSREIELRATKVSLEEYENETAVNFAAVTLRMTDAEAKLEAIETNVGNVSGIVTGMSSTLAIQAGKIEAKVSKTEFNEVVGRVETAESSLTMLPGQIEAKVSKGNIIASFTLEPETARLQAKYIDLDGYVTMSEFSASFADIGARLDTTYLVASKAEIETDLAVAGDMRYDGKLCSWKSGNFVTSVTFPVYQEDTIYYTGWDGSQKQMPVLRPTKKTNGSYSKSKDYQYMGYVST